MPHVPKGEGAGAAIDRRGESAARATAGATTVRPVPLRAAAAVVSALILATVAQPSAGAADAPRARPNVLLISIDSLRADHVGALGYPKATTPTIDRLAHAGALFTQGQSSTSWTLAAHASLFTGLPDDAHGVRTPKGHLDDAYSTIAEHFAAAGYRTVGFYSGPFLHPAFGVAQGFEEYVDCTSYQLGSFDLERRVPHAESHRDVTNPYVLWNFLRRLRSDDERPFFFFVHMWDVHYDLLPPPPYDRMFDPDYEGNFPAAHYRFEPGFRIGMDKRDYEHVLALYDGEIRYTDDTIGMMLAALDDRGLTANTLVVITSDHGDEFLDHGDKGHRHTLYQELLRVPIVFSMPGRVHPIRIDDTVGLIDVAPTITELAGLPPMPEAWGRSLVPAIDGHDLPPVPVLSELKAPPRVRDLSALVVGRAKIIVDHATHTAKYFDLASDPDEQSPRTLAQVPTAPRLLQLDGLLRARARQRARAVDGRRPAAVTPRVEQTLRELGYLE
jgi:choline-sulfatase